MQFNKTEVLRDGNKAILVWFEDISRQRWIPKSHLMRGSIRGVGERGLLIVSDWLGQTLINELGLNEPTYNDAYQEGFRDGYAAGRAEKPLERNTCSPELADASPIYRKLAVKWHPDREGGSAEVMKDLNQLWQAVSKH
jgi:hypothetical protein